MRSDSLARSAHFKNFNFKAKRKSVRFVTSYALSVPTLFAMLHVVTIFPQLRIGRYEATRLGTTRRTFAKS
jgi:hypothetical protein